MILEEESLLLDAPRIGAAAAAGLRRTPRQQAAPCPPSSTPQAPPFRRAPLPVSQPIMFPNTRSSALVLRVVPLELLRLLQASLLEAKAPFEFNLVRCGTPAPPLGPSPLT